jgi:hypothetical protein
MMNNATLIQTYFDNLHKEITREYPEYSFSQVEAIILRSMHGQLSSFRHRAQNPSQYAGQKYDPEGKLKIQEEEPINKDDIKFFSSQIPSC